MPTTPTIVILTDSAPKLPPPTDGHYAAVRCGRLGLCLVSTHSGQTLDITAPGTGTILLPLPDAGYHDFLRNSRRGHHALAWEDLLQWARNDRGQLLVPSGPDDEGVRLVDLIDSHTELWDGIDGHQPSAPGAVLPRPRGPLGRECLHVFTV